MVNDPEGGRGHGVRVFAGVRWDPFFMDAPAALKTIATQQLCFTDPGTIFLDGKNVLSLVVELDLSHLPGVGLVGFVAETVTRGTFNVRIERVGRPEVKNLMLAPKQFDQVNRDLEIRDLYNMEDAFSLGESYPGAYRARLDANLAFWDGLDGKIDWPRGDGAHPLTEVVLPGLPRHRRREAVCGAGQLSRDRARSPARAGAPELRRTGAQRRRHGHDLHPARDGGCRFTGPRRGRRRHPSGVDVLSLPCRPEPRSAHASRAPPLT